MLCLSLSRVLLFATPWTVARQARLSMGFSKQEHWSGFSCPLPTEEYLLPNNVAYFPPGKELLQRDLKKYVFLGEKMPHWENCKLLPFNNSSDVYHISLSAFVARKLRAGSHDPQEQLCWFPCGGGTRGPGDPGAGVLPACRGAEQGGAPAHLSRYSSHSLSTGRRPTLC